MAANHRARSRFTTCRLWDFASDENQAVIDHEGADETELTSAVKQLGDVAAIE